MGTDHWGRRLKCQDQLSEWDVFLAHLSCPCYLALPLSLPLPARDDRGDPSHAVGLGGAGAGHRSVQRREGRGLPATGPDPARATEHTLPPRCLTAGHGTELLSSGGLWWQHEPLEGSITLR